MTEQVWTIKDIIQWSSKYLQTAGSDTPRLDAELLLTRALNCRRLDLYLDHHKPLVSEERQRYRELIKRRALGEPIAYILETKDFYGYSFQVNQHALIPRPDTELLVEQVLASFPAGQTYQGLDVGTGSGCIAISIKKQRPDIEIWAWDISAEALALAQKNGRNLEASINWQQLDALSGQIWQESFQKFDFIVSNPPYIAIEERPGLAKSVSKFEPEIALFAADRGLQFYKVFAQYAQKSLRLGGKIFLEVGYRQASDVSSILACNGWQDLAILRDLAGHERVVVATRDA